MAVFRLFCILIVLVTVNCLPIFKNDDKVELPEIDSSEDVQVVNVSARDERLSRSSLRPGMQVRSYAIEIEPDIDSGTFTGTVLINALIIDQATISDPILFHVEDLDVNSVEVAIGGSTQYNDANFEVVDGELRITDLSRSTYWFRISYEGNLDPTAGLFVGSYDGGSYLAMNLFPTNARRVFPCIDEPTETSIISFTINEAPYANIISNTQLEAADSVSFKSMAGAPFRWALFGHDFTTYNVPVTNIVQLAGRPGLAGQENQASVAINSIYGTLNEWTNKPYLEIVNNQADNMHILAIPDVDIEWNTLSVIGLWEPYLMMVTQQHSVKQKQVALVKIAEAIARPWFGFTLVAENWIHQWIITGFQTYVAYEAVKELESGSTEAIDYDAIFVTDVIQEGLYRDGYASATILQPDDFIDDEVDIRSHINNGLLKYKAPAILSMLRLAMHEETDFIKVGAQGLFVQSNVDTVNTFNFLDNVGAPWDALDEKLFNNLEDFLNPYIKARGCPLLSVTYQRNLVTIARSTFNFAGVPSATNFFVPITFTTSADPDFENVIPSRVYNEPTSIEIPVTLGEDDWILFNIQGRGYYRVQYNPDMWERIIAALEDPERRNEIHHLNRATLLDDSLNLARRIASGLNYDIALRIVLSMELEKEYAVWKAYIRNMNFIRKRLDALVTNNDELDPQVYLRIVRRIISTVENDLDFRAENRVEPSMDTLTRGMVMDHACRAGSETCIAAAIDWFYLDNGVNPNIPRDLRPAIYCAMVREGEEDVREMLLELLEDSETRTMHDRVVILESLACSHDEGFIEGYLGETISDDSPYSIAEKFRIFTAIAESSYNNAKLALRFLRENTNDIRQHYGGSAKLEEALFVLANNIVENDMATDFRNWLGGNSHNLQDSQNAANVVQEIITENIAWSDRHLQDVYDWMEQNDATTAAVSMLLLCMTAFITLFS
ncbi:unnamed protein product [Chilo suppressalis]|uniref:Aminopeptidase n=1 Tax=Chilo suppressalis TaxID=168631 RepID=A0ABN8BGE2_CHISP|nr:unnamed protein product [Chilo suppressalis]